jgi:DNA-directed RNA polymerase specialized sigma54-like protein
MKTSELKQLIKEEIKNTLNKISSFKPGQKIQIQSSEKLIPATYIKKTNKGHQVKITKTMLGYKAGDVTEVNTNAVIPA